LAHNLQREWTGGTKLIAGSTAVIKPLPTRLPAMTIMFPLLEPFIVAAKRACYVGDGAPAQSSRVGSHDLVCEDATRFPGWSYRDSYFGGTEFIGQEVVRFENAPVWAMNYHGYVIRPDLIDAAKAGAIIKAALSAMYAEGRFLGGWEWVGEWGRYVDFSKGDVARFSGREAIWVDGVEAYALTYGGGVVVP
jgi:Domain of unknown function (DUF5680)